MDHVIKPRVLTPIEEAYREINEGHNPVLLARVMDGLNEHQMTTADMLVLSAMVLATGLGALPKGMPTDQVNATLQAVQFMAANMIREAMMEAALAGAELQAATIQ